MLGVRKITFIRCKPVTTHSTKNVELLDEPLEHLVAVLFPQSKFGEACLLSRLNGALVNDSIHLKVSTTRKYPLGRKPSPEHVITAVIITSISVTQTPNV